jgi:hypothetical protein
MHVHICLDGDRMTKAALEKLGRAVQAVRDLPDEAQEAIADELEQLISDFSHGRMSDAQRAEVRRRLGSPRHYVPDEEVRALLRRYNPAL